jgi:hypothetical protein
MKLFSGHVVKDLLGEPLDVRYGTAGVACD